MSRNVKDRPLSKTALLKEGRGSAARFEPFEKAGEAVQFLGLGVRQPNSEAGA
jgi:hypothetical protein